jgi:hypothetical protein
VAPAPTQTVTTPSPLGPITLGASVTDTSTVSPNPMLLWMMSRLFERFSGEKTADRPMMGHS